MRGGKEKYGEGERSMGREVEREMREGDERSEGMREK